MNSKKRVWRLAAALLAIAVALFVRLPASEFLKSGNAFGVASNPLPIQSKVALAPSIVPSDADFESTRIRSLAILEESALSRVRSDLLAEIRQAFQFKNDGNDAGFHEIVESLLASRSKMETAAELLASAAEADNEVRVQVTSILCIAIKVYTDAAASGVMDPSFDPEPFYSKLLSLMPAIAEDSAGEILNAIGSSRRFGSEHISEIAGFLGREALRQRAAIAIIEIASKNGMALSDFVLRFLDDPDTQVRNRALGKLVAVKPEIYLGIAEQRFLKSASEGNFDERSKIAAAVSRQAPAESALSFLRAMVLRGEGADLVMPFRDLHERGFGGLAAEHFILEKDPRFRRKLLLVVGDDASTLRFAVENDLDAGVRDQALLLLSARFPDDRAGQEVLAALTRGKENLWGGVYAAENLFQMVPSMAKAPLGRSILDALRHVSLDPGAPRTLREKAESMLVEWPL